MLFGTSFEHRSTGIESGIPVPENENETLIHRPARCQRDCMVLLTEVEPFFRVALMGFAFILTFLVGISAYRVHSTKLVLVTLGFLAFSGKGVLLTLGLFLTAFHQTFLASTEMIVIDFLVLVLLYAGTVKTA